MLPQSYQWCQSVNQPGCSEGCSSQGSQQAYSFRVVKHPLLRARPHTCLLLPPTCMALHLSPAAPYMHGPTPVSCCPLHAWSYTCLLLPPTCMALHLSPAAPYMHGLTPVSCCPLHAWPYTCLLLPPTCMALHLSPAAPYMTDTLARP